LPATAATRDQQLQALDRWLEDEEEIPVNPMARLKPPIVPDKPIPVVPMLDIGARRGGEAGLRVADLAFDLDVVLVLGKGRRERALPFGRTTAVALDR
jgi:integrase/recombinase XerC